MKILFTGASSFTGYWFVKKLAEKGHHVTCTFTGQAADYSAGRGERVQEVLKHAKPAYGIKFGDEGFIKLIETGKFDVLCHHAAYVTGYKDFDFDVAAAVSNNANNILNTLKALVAAGTTKLVLTGSVFEGGEGGGSDGLPHFSPYGLSKSLSAQMFEFYANHFKLTYGKFVIPNPFGPFEDPRFTSYLINNWFKKATPKVNTPDYVRDNISVELLADYYAYFCEKTAKQEGGKLKLAPSGIVSSQGAFTAIVSRELSTRLNLPCEYELAVQTSFTEPLIRINTDRINEIDKAFNEKKFWDAFAEFYAKRVVVPA